MLYIQKLKITESDFIDIVNQMKAVVEKDYYNTDAGAGNRGTHFLPLPVVNLFYNDIFEVQTGYTSLAEEGLFTYTTSAGNMCGAFEGVSEDEFYFFMYGRRHGISTTMLPEDFVPEYIKEDTAVYITMNQDVSPFDIDVGLGKSVTGSSWPSVPTPVSSKYILGDMIANLGEYCRLTPSKLNRILPAYVIANADDVPVDIAHVRLENIILADEVDHITLPVLDVLGIKVAVTGFEYVGDKAIATIDKYKLSIYKDDQRAQLSRV